MFFREHEIMQCFDEFSEHVCSNPVTDVSVEVKNKDQPKMTKIFLATALYFISVFLPGGPALITC